MAIATISQQQQLIRTMILAFFSPVIYGQGFLDAGTM
jgi:hypothetical protein